MLEKAIVKRHMYKITWLLLMGQSKSSQVSVFSLDNSTRRLCIVSSGCNTHNGGGTGRCSDDVGTTLKRDPSHDEK